VENVIWLSDHVEPQLTKQLSGTFEAWSDWSACRIDLCLSNEGILKGNFCVAEQNLGVIGGIGKSGRAFGFLLEPVGGVPVALFRMNVLEDELSLELDIPEFDDMMDFCSPERLKFRRTSVANILD
jgi:hypothetical protein